MSRTKNETSGLSGPRQSKTWTQLIAVGCVLLLYGILIFYQLRSGRWPSVRGFIFYLAVISPLTIVIMWLLLRFLCGEKLRDLNLKPGKLPSDLLAALILCPIILVANVVANSFLSELLPRSASGAIMRDIFTEIARDPGQLVLFAGPLVFLGAASEELVRVFLLSRLWKAWPSDAGKWAAVVFTSCLFGLMHVYRGPAHVVWAAVFGLIMAVYYLRFGRAAPLILAHYATNALQVLVAAAMAR